MGLSAGRLVRGDDPSAVETADALVTEGHHRRVAREEVDAREAAAALLADAEARASALVEAARASAGAVARAAADDARQAAEASLSALYLRIRREDESRAERDLQRSVELAVVLAERLLRAELELDASRIARLAQQALAEARGARRATIAASPLDMDALRRHLSDTGFGPLAVDLQPDETLERGSLRITTNLGILDAQLRPQLERLARALRDAIAHP